VVALHPDGRFGDRGEAVLIHFNSFLIAASIYFTLAKAVFFDYSWFA